MLGRFRGCFEGMCGKLFGGCRTVSALAIIRRGITSSTAAAGTCVPGAEARRLDDKLDSIAEFLAAKALDAGEREKDRPNSHKR